MHTGMADLQEGKSKNSLLSLEEKKADGNEAKVSASKKKGGLFDGLNLGEQNKNRENHTTSLFGSKKQLACEEETEMAAPKPKKGLFGELNTGLEKNLQEGKN